MMSAAAATTMTKTAAPIAIQVPVGIPLLVGGCGASLGDGEADCAGIKVCDDAIDDAVSAGC